MKKNTVISLILVICTFLLLGFSTVAWFSIPDNKIGTEDKITNARVIQQYFHCGSGTEADPFVITRPIHYYHLVELYQRMPDFDGEDYYFQLGYNLDGDTSTPYQVYAYDEYGAIIMEDLKDSSGNTVYESDGVTPVKTEKVTDTLNMAYYSGDLSLLPIGTPEHPFNGRFDGKGLTIANLSIKSFETVGSTTYGSSDIGIFGTVLNVLEDGESTWRAVVKNIYYDNVTISLAGASASYNSTLDYSAIHDGNDICVGYVIGHCYNYINAKNRDYLQKLVGTNASPISNVYVNNVTVTGGTSANVVNDYGLVGHVEALDGETVQSIRVQLSDGGQFGEGAGEDSWGGSIDMTELYNRVSEIISNSSSSSNRFYPTSETVIQSSSQLESPGTIMTGKSSGSLSSDYGRIYYWAAERDNLNVSVDSTGGAVFGSTGGGGDWNYLYGLKSSQTTATTSYTKTGALVIAYYLYDNGAYLGFDGSAVSGKKAAKDAVKLIAYGKTEDNGLVSAKYYVLIDNVEYYLTASGTTGIAFTTNRDSAVTWMKNGSNEFYTELTDPADSQVKNFYLFYDGSWTLAKSTTRYAIGDDAGHYLSGTTAGVADEASLSEAYIWQMTENAGAHYFFFESAGARYYLAIKNGALTISPSGASAAYAWQTSATNGSGAMKLYATIGGVNYYLSYDGGWKVTIDGFLIHNGDHYVKATTAGVTDAARTDATIFQLQTDANGTKIVAPIDGIAYYLTFVGETLKLSNTTTYWTRTQSSGTSVFSRAVTYDTTADTFRQYLNGTYFLAFDANKGWYACPETGYYIASDGKYLSLDENYQLVATTDVSRAQIWQYRPYSSTQKSSNILTLVGEQIFYLNFDKNELVLSETALLWNMQGSNSFFKYIGKYYGTEDRVRIGCREDGTFGLFVSEYASGNSTAHCFTLCDPTEEHYLTYSLKYNTGSNYLVVDGDRAAACTWLIKETGATSDSKPVVVIYTYIGVTRYFLTVIDGTLCITATESTWLKSANLGNSGRDGYSQNGYYLSFESPSWTLIDLTAAVKLNYTDLGGASHYLFTTGTGLGVATESASANNWIYRSSENALTTNIGSTKYYLTYEVKTVKVKASDESLAVLDAYRVLVPTVSTVQPAVVWQKDASDHYYITLNNVKFYLYFDEDNYEWAFAEQDGYQIKDGSSYLTLCEAPVDLSAGTITFQLGTLCRSTVPNYQWHLINGQIFTFIGDTPYYLSYTSSNAKAQQISVTTTPSAGTFTKQGTALYQTIANVAFRFAYVGGDVTLPANYTRIEYLQSTGDQIIDTGVVDATNITIDCDIEAPAKKSKYLFGSQEDRGDYIQNGLYSNNNGTYTLYYAFGTGPNTSSNRLKMTQTLSGTTMTVTLNGTTASYAASSSAGYVPRGNIYLFGDKNSAGAFNYIGAGMKIYRFTIKRDNVVIRDFVPVIRADGVMGLYDLVEGKFYTGIYDTFSGGGTSTLDSGTVSEISANGYTALEYLQSTGDQIIDTGVVDATDVTIDCDVEGPAKKSKYLFGSQEDRGDYIQNGLYSNSNGTYTLYYAFGNGPNVSSSRLQMTQTLSADGSTMTVTLNGTTASYAASSSAGYVPRGNVYIFGDKNASGVTQYIGTGMKVYRFTVKKAGTVVRDFVPVMRNNDGMYGLYDLVEGKFYTNENVVVTRFTGAAPSFYMIPENGYTSIASGNTYMTVDTSRNIGSATKNAANLYEYHQFKVTSAGSGNYYVTSTFGGVTYYLTTNDAGATVAERGTLSFTTAAVTWSVENTNRYYRTVAGEKYYLGYQSSTSKWIASPDQVTLNFRYMLSNNQYMVLNSAKTGITSKAASSVTDTATDTDIRWFTDGQKVYTQSGNVNYYLVWSASAGFSVTTTKNNGTNFTIGTNTLGVTDSGLTLYVINDYSGWNVSAHGKDYIYSGSSYINATSATALGIGGTGKTRWINKDNKIYSFYAGKAVYWTTSNGSTVTLTGTSASATSWTVSSGKYSTVYNGITYSLYLNGSTLSLVGPKGYYIYAITRITSTDDSDHMYLIHSSNTATNPGYRQTSSMTEAKGGLWSVSNSKIYFTYTSGSNTYSRYLTYGSTNAPSSSGSSFSIESSAGTTTWTYNATTHRLTMTKGSLTGYVALRIANDSIQGWKVFSSDTIDPVTKADNKATGNYFDVYIDPVYDSSQVTTFSTSSQTSVPNILNSGNYESGMEPQDISFKQTTESYFAFGSQNSTAPATVPASETQQARTTTNVKTSSYKSGEHTVFPAQKSFTAQAHTVDAYSASPAWISVLSTTTNPQVTFITTTDQLYESTVTAYKRGTYLPIKTSYTDETKTAYSSDYHAGEKNTGYIVGGAYSGESGSGQGDIRISVYSSSNISGSYNRSYGTFSNLYTFNGSGTTPVRINDSANSYQKYEYTKEKFLDILSLNKSNVYGLHFMDAQISTDHIMVAESVRVLGKTYTNYELPESAIDFNVAEQGYIILYAGDYYNGNSAFFSLHKVFRDDNQHITDIKEIAEIYTKNNLKGYEHYVYKFSDGTYTDGRGNYVDAQLTSAVLTALGYQTTPLFSMSWLTNPTNGRGFSNDYIYYFEIPCNEGEYCLGSVEGQDGGYLLYLDIASNGGRSSSYNQVANISSDPLFTQMGYLDEGILVNSVVNLAYSVPQGNTASNFSVKVSYDRTNDYLEKEGDEEYCKIVDIDIVNETGLPMDIYVLLVDDDDDIYDAYYYRYRIKYNGEYYTESRAYDSGSGVFFATVSLTLPGTS